MILFLFSVSSREWSPADDDSETLDILKPVENTLKNSGPAFYGEFTINLKKVNGSLGFTLRQTDDTVLKHTIKALVKDPAISDGRIKPGDKLLTCNGVDLSNFSHQEQIGERISSELFEEMCIPKDYFVANLQVLV